MPKRKTLKEFINEASTIHGNKYDYSKVEYVNNKTKVKITCPQHGEFFQTPSMHITGRGCPCCGGSKKLTTKDFIEKSRYIHGDKYDYSESEYINNRTKVKIICPEHEKFLQTPDAHLRGEGCPKCAHKKSGKKRLTKDDFVERASKIHGDKYDYSKSEYINFGTKLEIVCKKDNHGSFLQSPSAHLNGRGCPICGEHKRISTNSTSNLEKQLHKKLSKKFGAKNVKKNYNSNNRYPFVCDFYIPERDLFIEFNGWWMHSNEWYDGRSNISKEKVDFWKSKNSSQYIRAIKTYTERDVLKRKTAKKNHLNYVVLWNEHDIEDWFALGCPDGHDGDGMYTWKEKVKND